MVILILVPAILIQPAGDGTAFSSSVLILIPTITQIIIAIIIDHSGLQSDFEFGHEPESPLPLR